MLKTQKFRLKGQVPLIMHNGQLAHPLNPYAKAVREIAAKRKKTDADFEEMSHLEFLGSFYLTDDGVPCIPAHVIRGALMGKGGASRKQRMGKNAELGIFITGNFPLEYDGPKDPEKMWKDGKFRFDSLEKIQNSKIARTRPIIKDWSLVVEVTYNEDFVNPDTVEYLMIIAGNECGLCERRPTYGRFSVEKL